MSEKDKAVRGEAVRDIERRTLKAITDSLSMRTFGEMLDRGQPASYLVTEEGTFMLTIHRVSKAIMAPPPESTPGTSVSDGTPS